MSLTLRSSPSSPFARKARAAADIIGLSDQIVIENAVTKDLEPSLLAQNPLGKIPALVLGDGRVLYDSCVIVEYFDTIGGGNLIPSETDEKFSALTLAALCDGIMDAALMILYESRYRPDVEPYEPWITYQLDKIRRGLAMVGAVPPPAVPVTVGTLGMAIMLEYLEFRSIFDWREKRPNLVEWLEEFNAVVPEFKNSAPV